MTTGSPHSDGGGRDVGHPPQRKPARRARKNPKRRRLSARSRRVLRLATFVLTPVLILAVLGIIITYTRLLQGPVSLARFVEPIEQSMSQSLGALSADIEDVRLVLNDDHTFEFRLINIAVLDSTGARVAAAPLASASLSLTALLTGNIVPTRIYLIDPNLLVTYRKDAGFSLQVASKLVEQPALVGEGQLSAPSPSGPVPGGNAETELRVQNAPAPPAQRIDLARLIADMNSRAQRGMGDNQLLEQIGVRNAVVSVDYDGQVSEWLIAEAAIDLERGRERNAISGAARVQSSQGPWLFSFQTVESERDNVVRLTVSARDLVPSSLSVAAPAFSLLKPLDMPISLDATMQVSESGDMEAATLAIEFAPGSVHLPNLSGTPVQFDRSIFNLAYDGFENRLTIAPSTLRWAGSFLTVAGLAVPDKTATADGAPWIYHLTAVDGALAAQTVNAQSVKVDTWEMKGHVSLQSGRLGVDSFALLAGGVDVSGTGAFTTGREQTSTRLDLDLKSRDLKLLTALWPRAVAPDARAWFGKSVRSGKVKSGAVKILSGGFTEGEAPSLSGQPMRVSLAFELNDLEVLHEYGQMPLRAERALVRLENDALEVTIPKLQLADKRAGDIAIKTFRFNAVRLFQQRPKGEIAFKVRAPVKSLLNVAQRVKPEMVQNVSAADLPIRGLFVGDFKLSVPLSEADGETIKFEDGRGEIKDLRFSKKLGEYAINGGAFDIDLSTEAIEASGNILINGVGFKVKAHHILGAEPDKQPPVRIKGVLDGADRDQLGLDVNDIVAGDLPIEVTARMSQTGAPNIHVGVDLTGADLLFAEVAWRKPSGRDMRAEFDVIDGDGGRTELQNIQVVGQGIAIEGWAAVGKNKLLEEFYFPDFSVDTVTRLSLQGKQSKARIWSVKAVGPTYDGRTFFKSLFKLGDLASERPKARNPSKGVDVSAQIENVVGSNKTSLRQVRLTVSHRGGKLSALDGKAKLDNGKNVAVLMKRKKGKRTLFVESNDAGKVFKLIDFYPNMVGGHARLELDLDGYGAAEQTGILWAENFRILGDEVASEVFAGASGGSSGRRVTRQVFDFSTLRLPFSIGHDQFVIKKSYLRGPVLGASVSGKVDYRLRRVNLGGSYIPLQGINSALCGIPLLGQIITGPKCEGVLGITFAVQGSMARPQVIVNPLSLVAPGIFREIFQLTNPNVKVTPRSQGGPSGSPEQRVRSSSSATKSDGRQGRRPETGGAVIDGWSSGTRATP